MNSVSWFLYFSDVVGNLQPLFGIAAGICVCVALVCVLAYAVEDWEGGATYSRRWAIASVPLALICVLIPDKSTMYGIAASQVGEQLAANDDVKGLASDARKALQQWIKRQIDSDGRK